MAKLSLIEKMEKEHQKLLEKVDELDRLVNEALKEWGAARKAEDDESAEEKTDEPEVIR